MKKLSRKQTEKSSVGIPVSMESVQWKWIDDRVKALAPMIKTRSHYIQVLVDMDQKHGLIAALRKPLVKQRR